MNMGIVPDRKINDASAVQPFVMKACESDARACTTQKGKECGKTGEQFKVYYTGNFFSTAPSDKREHTKKKRKEVGYSFLNAVTGVQIVFLKI